MVSSWKEAMPDGLTPDADGRNALPGALRLGLIYLAVALGLAISSDWAITRWVSDPALRATLQTGSEIFFIVGTGGLITFLAFRELKRSKDFQGHYRTVVEQTLAGLSVVQDDRFIFVNERFAELFGYEPHELIGSVRVIDVISPEDRDDVGEQLRRRMEGEIDDVHYRYTGLTKQGDRIRVEVYGRRIEWEGEPAVTSLHLDVTEVESLREQARRSQRLEELGQLTGAVAHDFNNLLTTILAPLELCKRYLDESHPAWGEVEEAKKSARRAVSLTRQLLAFSRQRIYRPRPIDIRELVQGLATMLARLSGSGVEIHVELGEAPLAVEVDPSHFAQVLLNLVTNAREAVQRHGDIWIRAYPTDAKGPSASTVVIEVEDNGVGMDDETLGHLFEPFFTTREQGTGLGLSTAHGIVEQAGGNISVTSTPGRGTTFRIRLPGTEKPPEPVEAAEPEKEQSEERPEEGEEKMSVLVVDDEEDVLRVTGRVLERHGFEVTLAGTAQKAIALAGNGRDFGLLLTDIGLPQMNGVELAAKIREMDGDLPVLYMSGRSDREVLDQLAQDPSVKFIEKPFSVDQLLGAVHLAAMGADERLSDAG